MRRSLWFIPLLALLPCFTLACGATWSWPLVAKWHGDLTVYAGYADKLLAGQVPYRDVLPEYPPLALLAFVLPRLFAGGATISEGQFRALFLLENLFWLWLIAFAALHIAQVARVALWRTIINLSLLTAILSPFLAWRFDLFPAMLTALGLLALVRGQAAFGGWWFGLGVAAKLYPLVLGPVATLEYLVTRKWRALAGLVFGAALAVALTVLPFLLLEPAGLLHFLSYHEQRGIQIESVAGGIVCLGRVLNLTSADVAFNYGAMHLASPWASALLPWLTPLLFVVYAGLLLLAWLSRRRLALSCVAPEIGAAQQATWLVRASCAALLVFIVTNKVFSPQYLAWLLPFVPLLPLRKVVLVALVCGATVAIFPFGYDALLAFNLQSILLLNLRNAGLVALLGWLLYSLARPAAQSL